jgi:predicted glycogen debranching enzyme
LRGKGGLRTCFFLPTAYSLQSIAYNGSIIMKAFIDIEAEVCQNPKKSLEMEWLLSNGLGGFASSTPSCINVRKYHALLIAPLTPPTNRYMLLSGYHEKIIIDDKGFTLSTPWVNRSEGEDDSNYLVNFRLDPFPVFTYFCEGWEIEKRIIMPHEQNTILVRYRVLSGNGVIKLVAAPLLGFRDVHTVSSEDISYESVLEITDDAHFVFKPPEGCCSLYFQHNAKEVIPCYKMRELYYPVEKSLGYDAKDNVLRGCEIIFEIEKGKPAHIIASLEDNEPDHPLNLERAEIRRISALVNHAHDIHPEKKEDPVLENLVVSADSFVIKRGNGISMIAGYPWFTDWGRDTMIALPGIFLVTGRYEEARKLLLAFLDHYRDGLIPNTFPEGGEDPIYNTVDASLWYIHSCYEYYLATNDIDTVRAPFFPVIKDIIRNYIKGTDFRIRQHPDGLISAGEYGVQLTWMDAKVNDIVVTPRMGKNVEINALWYHSLKIAAFFSDILGDEEEFAAYEIHAEKVKNSFEEEFWFEDGGYLYDTLEEEEKDSSNRPNQIFAISLPHQVITGEKAEKILDNVSRVLLTPYGLRSLSPSHPDYESIYSGNLLNRDLAYHQGTVWGWLIGPYIDAFLNVKGCDKKVAEEGLQLIQPLIDHLEKAGLGSISEIFCGDPPHTPCGCFAQAWSVSELLRSYIRLLNIKSAVED